MSFGGKLVVSYLTKIRVEFINQVTDCKLRKIAPYRHPKFGGFRKKPYLCTVIQRYHTGFSEWQELITFLFITKNH